MFGEEYLFVKCSVLLIQTLFFSLLFVAIMVSK